MVTKVDFSSGMTGYIARPDTREKRPALINVHERYGLVQHTTDLTQKVADAGYVGFAPDLFWRSPDDREGLASGEVRAQMQPDEVIEDLNTVIDYLKTLDYVDPDRIGIMGVCASGGPALLIAAHRQDLSSVVLFYGGTSMAAWEPKEPGREPLGALLDRIECPIFGAFGEGDNNHSVEEILRFRSYLESRNKSFRIRIYRDAPHGWLNDTMPGRYRKEATKAAWKRMLTFLEETFGDGWDRSRVLWEFDSDISPDYDFTKNVRYE